MDFADLKSIQDEFDKKLKPKPRMPHPAAPAGDAPPVKRGGAVVGVAAAAVDDEDPLKAIFDANRRRLLSLPGVTGVDIGYRIVDGEFTNDLAIRLHVERKVDKNAKEAFLERYPERKFEFIEHVLAKACKGKAARLTDVIQAIYGPLARRPSPLLENPSSSKELSPDLQQKLLRFRVNPLAGGISIGSQGSAGGTLGAVVWDKTDGSVCALSNWHVLAGRPETAVGNPCFQPGLFDQGLPGDDVARLKRWSFGRNSDAALAGLTNSRRYCTSEILGFPGPIIDAIEPRLGMVVYKLGCSTGFTAGFVDGLHFTAPIAYWGGVTHLFEEQIHIAPFSQQDQLSEPGDSGAVWVTLAPEGLMAVGLHFAGNLPNASFGEFALANPMTELQKRLDFSFRPVFVDEDEPTRPPAPLAPALLEALSNMVPTEAATGLTDAGDQGPIVRTGPP